MASTFSVTRMIAWRPTVRETYSRECSHSRAIAVTNFPCRRASSSGVTIDVSGITGLNAPLFVRDIAVPRNVTQAVADCCVPKLQPQLPQSVSTEPCFEARDLLLAIPARRFPRSVAACATV